MHRAARGRRTTRCFRRAASQSNEPLQGSEPLQSDPSFDAFVSTIAPSDGSTAAEDETITPEPDESSTEETSTVTVTSTPDPNANADPNDYVVQRVNINFDQLLSINSDAVAWLYLQDSQINYPVMKAPLDDPDYYLDHLYDRSENIVGSLFIDPTTDETFSGRNAVIHGHRMNNGSMFGTLNRYKKQTYYNGNPIMQLYTPAGITDYYVYIFAAYETDISSYYRTVFSDDADFQTYLNECISKSVISTLVTPTASDSIVTLSTCVLGNDLKRMVVQGILVPME
ncbi:MAG: class B sortase [Clostridia bacterium]|nr:class B sortase [Clostridia bacterium]